MDDLSFLVPIAFIAFFGIMIYWVISSQQKRTAAKRQRAASLGLKPLASPPSDLMNRLLRLRPFNRSEKPTLKNIFTRHLPDGVLYLFDLEVQSGTEDPSTTEDMVLVISSVLNLPRFGIFPAPAALQNNILGGVFGKLMQWATSKANLVVVPVREPQSFAGRYALLAESAERVEGLVQSGLLEQLAGVENQHIQAEGDAFTCSTMKFGQPTSPAEDHLPALIDQAQRILNILAEYRQTVSFSS